MKIVIITPHCPPVHIGGTERMSIRLSGLMQQRGHELDVVCIESIDAENGHPFCVTETFDNVRVHRLFYNENSFPDKLRLSFRNPMVGEWLKDFFKEQQPDIVHVLSGYLVSGSVVDAATDLGIATIVTLLDFWFICPQITLLRTDGSLCDHPVPAARCEWCALSQKRRYLVPDRWLKGRLGDVFTGLNSHEALAKLLGNQQRIAAFEERRTYLKQVLEKATIVITHSKFLEQKIHDYGIFPKQVLYLPNGLELSAIPLAELKPVTSKPVRIGYLGQIAPHKGVRVLVEAFMKLKPDPDQGTLHIYGNLTQWPGYVQEMMRASKQFSNIHWEGSYQFQELPAVINGLDVIVVPSIWFENRPTTILEAFAYGKPVITSDLGGMAEMVKHGVDGLLFRADDADDLAGCLRSVVLEPGVLQKLRDGVSDVKSVGQEIDELEALYQQLLQRS
jgi:glycosyltransferase involved in cell wall biosynthesis